MRSQSAIGTAFPKDDIAHLAKATSVRALRRRCSRHRLQQHFSQSNPHSTTLLLTAVSRPAVSSLGGCPTPAAHTAATQRPTLARAGVRQSLPTRVVRVHLPNFRIRVSRPLLVSPAWVGRLPLLCTKSPVLHDKYPASHHAFAAQIYFGAVMRPLFIR
jgi:hypothetical protein